MATETSIIPLRERRRDADNGISAKRNLSDAQLLALHRIASFGWQLAFVRQPLFQSPQTVVVSPDKKRYAVLDDRGDIDTFTPLNVRH